MKLISKLINLFRIPEGYQNEKGFHYGKPPLPTLRPLLPSDTRLCIPWQEHEATLAVYREQNWRLGQKIDQLKIENEGLRAELQRLSNSNPPVQPPPVQAQPGTDLWDT